MIQFILKKKWWFVGGGILLIIVGTQFLGNGEEGQFEFAEVAYNDIVQEVSVTGTVESDSKIDLKFQRAGQVDSIPVDVGDFVVAGDTLANLDVTALQIEVSAASADLALAHAKYDQAVAGSTDEEVMIAQAAFDKAAADLEQAEQTLSSTTVLSEATVDAAELDYNAALTSYNNAVETYGEDLIHAYEDAYNTLDDTLDEVDDSLRDVDNILGVDNETANDAFELSIEQTGNIYRESKALYEDAELIHDDLVDAFAEITSSDYTELDDLLDQARDLLDDMDFLLEDVDDLLVECELIGGMTTAVKDAKREIIASELGDISTATASLDNAIQAVESASTSEGTSLNTASDTLAEAEQALSLAEAQAAADVTSAEVSVSVYEALYAQSEATLAQAEAGPRDVDLASLTASINAAAASYDLAQYNLSLAYITAPVSGVITQINFDEGENVSITDNFMVMLSEDYQITANVSETDIAKVQIGDKVQMTLDAFSFEKEFEAEVVEIDPAETVIQGVIYYQITAVFKAEDTDIKPGMTANMDIVTAELNNVLSVPVRAVKYDGSRTYVLKVNGDQETYEVDVEVGVRGDQYIEIIDGIEEGDKVVTYVR